MFDCLKIYVDFFRYKLDCVWKPKHNHTFNLEVMPFAYFNKFFHYKEIDFYALVRALEPENCTTNRNISQSIEIVYITNYCVAEHPDDIRKFKKCFHRNTYFFNLYCDMSQALVDGKCIERQGNSKWELFQPVSQKKNYFVFSYKYVLILRFLFL